MRLDRYRRSVGVKKPITYRTQGPTVPRSRGLTYRAQKPAPAHQPAARRPAALCKGGGKRGLAAAGPVLRPKPTPMGAKRPRPRRCLSALSAKKNQKKSPVFPTTSQRVSSPPLESSGGSEVLGPWGPVAFIFLYCRPSSAAPALPQKKCDPPLGAGCSARTRRPRALITHPQLLV
jgi:hypothetical protein